MTALKVAIQEFPANQSFSPDTVGELESLEETLVWRWYTTVIKKDLQNILKLI